MTLAEPQFPCRHDEFRACPKIYNGICGDRPCARFESEDEEPWILEVIETYVRYR